MDHPMEHDALSVSMFWAGALMMFAPLAYAGIVLYFWRRTRRGGPQPGGDQPASDDAQASGSTTRPK